MEERLAQLKSKGHIGFLLVLLVGSLSVQGQGNRASLEKKIKLTGQLLHETAAKTKKSPSELRLIREQIRLRDQLIGALTEEIQQHEEEVIEMEGIICSMEEDIVSLKKQYAETARLTYRSFDADNFWLSLLSSESLTEAYYRIAYFRQFSQQRKEQITLIRKSQEFLLRKSEDLKVRLAAKEALLADKEAELDRLSRDKGIQKDLYVSLKNEAKGYAQAEKNKQKEVQGIIKTAEKTSVSPPKATPATGDYKKTFARNRGYLVWPISSGRAVVVGKFGKTEDPFGNQVNNDGIFIRTTEGQAVRAVYEGTVTGVQTLPVGGKVVILEHGSYRTVYANLSETLVVKGDKLKASQHLGTVYTDNRTGESMLQFMIYKMPDKFQNPERWLIRH
ncbi:MAG: peptidoglycan DD-metalloendopeptidase family protein [Bacteroidota bacterium]